MHSMRDKNKQVVIRLDTALLDAINALARRMGDKNTSAAARLAMRVGLQTLERQSISEILANHVIPKESPS